MIKHLEGLEINSIYDFDNAFSINELLCKFWEKIEESINISNESIDILNWIKEQGLPDEIINLMTEWHENGKLSEIINIQKFEQLKSEFQTFVNENITELRNTLTSQTNSQNTKLNELQTTLESCEEDIATNYNYINTVENNCVQSLNEYKNSVSSNYQPMKDTSLNTNSKMVVGAINEVNGKATPEAQNDSDGYRQFYDGLMVEWGSVLIQTADYVGQTNAIFPKPFGKLYNVIVGMEGATGWMNVSVKDRHLTGFTVEGKCNKGANDEKYGIGAVRINWIAIGEV